MNKQLQDNICNETLFNKAFKTYAKDLHNYLYYKYGNLLNPKDKVQEAFIKLWQNCGKVTPNKAKGYLYTIANNLMLNEVAHQKVVLKYQKNKPKEYTHENPEFLMEESEYKQKLQLAISNLTKPNVLLFY